MAAPFDLITEAKRFIRFNTSTWEGNADCAVWMGSLMRRLGLEVSYQESRVGETLFLNVLGQAGTGKGPVLLATHLDTVPPGDPRLWTRSGGDPWRLTVRGDALVGLGVADTKLDLLCKLLAFSRVKPASLKRPVQILGTFGEESGLRGAVRFCQGEVLKPEMALVGEPSGLALVTRHKGLAVVEITFRTRGLHRPNVEGWVYEAEFGGEAAHSSTPELGDNAILKSLAFLDGLRKRPGKISILSWEGGISHNVIPPSARLRFSLGEGPKRGFPARKRQKVRPTRLPAGWYPTLPREDALWCIEAFGAVFAPLQKEKDRAIQPPNLTWNVTQLKETKEGWLLTFDVRALPGQSLRRPLKALEQKLWKKLGHPGSDWFFRVERDNPPLEAEATSAVVRYARAALKSARLPVRIEGKAGCSEAGLYSRVGIPSVVFGPGKSAGNIHRPNETASLRQLRAAARFYEAFIRRTCL